MGARLAADRAIARSRARIIVRSLGADHCPRLFFLRPTPRLSPSYRGYSSSILFRRGCRALRPTVLCADPGIASMLRMHGVARISVNTAIAIIVFAAIAAAPAGGQEYWRPQPPMPGPYSYGHPGCPGGYISVLGDICEPYFPPMRAKRQAVKGCPSYYKRHGRICKRDSAQ